MTRQTKRQKKIYELVSSKNDLLAKYKPLEAFKILTSDYADCAAKFKESVDLCVILSSDTNKPDQLIKGSCSLPNGTGKTVRVIAFTEEDKAKDAINAGAVDAGCETLIEKILSGFSDFDVAVASQAVVAKLSKIARVLGPRGLMPNAKLGTVGNDVISMIVDFSKGKVSFKCDKSASVKVCVGKIDFSPDFLSQNLDAIIQTIKSLKPSAVKGKFIKNVFVSTTMGVSVKIDTSDYNF